MASYPYEQLDDESFQHLSQSLLVKEFPGLQCFPVGQPDGGRDATFRLFKPASDTSGFIPLPGKVCETSSRPIRGAQVASGNAEERAAQS